MFVPSYEGNPALNPSTNLHPDLSHTYSQVASVEPKTQTPLPSFVCLAHGNRFQSSNSWDLWCLTADPSKIMQKHIAFKPSPSGSPCISLGSPSLWAAATAS